MSSSASSSSSMTESPAPPSPPASRKRKRAPPPIVDQEEPTVDLLDEPAPLSHAEKRRQKKGKSLKSSKDQDLGASTASATKLTDDDAPAGVPAKAPRQNSVWVGNLSFKTTADALRTFFEAAGEVTRIMIPMKPAATPKGKWKDAAPTEKAENKGFAYVDFSTPEGQAAAIAMSEGHLDGRRLLIKAGDNFEGRPTPVTTGPAEGTPAAWRTKFAKKVLAAQKQQPAPTLFLGNLGFETTEASIREVLDAHRRQTSKGKAKEVPAVAGEDKEDKEAGEEKKGKEEPRIRQVRLGTFEDSGKCKGWAFVDFTTKEHATDALVNPHNYHLDGRDIKLEFASVDAVRRGSAKPAKPTNVRKPRVANPDPKAKYNNKKRSHGDAEQPPAQHSSPANKPSVEATGEERPAKRQRAEAKPVKPHESRAATRPGKDTTAKGKSPKDRARPRPTPGAALALAKRESTAIVTSEGKKIKF